MNRQRRVESVWPNSFKLAVIIMFFFVTSSMMLRACQGDQHLTAREVDDQTNRAYQNIENKKKLGW